MLDSCVRGYNLHLPRAVAGAPYELPPIVGLDVIAGAHARPGGFEAYRRRVASHLFVTGVPFERAWLHARQADGFLRETYDNPRWTPERAAKAIAAHMLRTDLETAGAMYAQTYGYEDAAALLDAAAGALLDGWPVGTEGLVLTGYTITEGLGERDIEAFRQHLLKGIPQILARYKGAVWTPNWVEERIKDVRDSKARGGDGGVRADTELYRARLRQGLARMIHRQLGPGELKWIDDGLSSLYDAAGPSGLSSVARSVTSVVKPIARTVTNAAAALVDGAKKLNPVAIAKLAALKAKALAGSIKDSAAFALVKGVASKVAAPALKIIRDVGSATIPYVQAVASVVPAFGPGVSAALGAGQALADGKRIDEIGMAAMEGAIPGGPLAKMAFKLGAGMVQGKPIEAAALSAIRDQIPTSFGKQALDTGIAMGSAKNAQERRAALQTAALASLVPA